MRTCWPRFSPRCWTWTGGTRRHFFAWAVALSATRLVVGSGCRRGGIPLQAVFVTRPHRARPRPTRTRPADPLPGGRARHVPLSYAQRRLWFLPLEALSTYTSLSPCGCAGPRRRGAGGGSKRRGGRARVPAYRLPGQGVANNASFRVGPLHRSTTSRRNITRLVAGLHHFDLAAEIPSGRAALISPPTTSSCSWSTTSPTGSCVHSCAIWPRPTSCIKAPRSLPPRPARDYTLWRGPFSGTSVIRVVAPP